jgi:hypothetical protein
MLNDRYNVAWQTDKEIPRIYIKDSYSDYKQPTYVYTDEESKRVPLYTEAENRPVYLYDESELAPDGIDFIVCVPEAVVFDVNEMTAIINTYKLASKQFSIIQY